FSAGLFWIPFDTLVAQKSHKDNRAYAYGRKDLAVGLGLFIGGIIGFTMYGISLAFDIKNVFFVYGAIPFFGISNFIAAVAFLIKIDETLRIDTEEILETSNNNVKKNNNEAKQTKSRTQRTLILGLIFLSVVILLSCINDTLVKPFLNIYVLENINEEQFYAMAAYIPAGVTSMLLAPRVGRIVDKIHPAVGVTITSILGALITYILINTSSIVGFALLLLFDTTIAKVAALVVQNIISRVSLKHRGKMMGAKLLFQNLGFITGPIFGGLAWDSLGQKSPFIISIFVELSLIPFYWLAVKYIAKNLKEKL
ncbi:MAG: MFS transporter, partial [Candidatus Lokiarchaeota archaeon]|nr:MFS transporter [Candidatus Lokiarchaeota archaeon]